MGRIGFDQDPSQGEETYDLQRASMVLSVTNAGHAGITRW